MVGDTSSGSFDSPLLLRRSGSLKMTGGEGLLCGSRMLARAPLGATESSPACSTRTALCAGEGQCRESVHKKQLVPPGTAEYNAFPCPIRVCCITAYFPQTTQAPDR